METRLVCLGDDDGSSSISLSNTRSGEEGERDETTTYLGCGCCARHCCGLSPHGGTSRPILTSIAFHGSTLWGAIWALVPGLADVVPLTP